MQYGVADCRRLMTGKHEPSDSCTNMEACGPAVDAQKTIGILFNDQFYKTVFVVSRQNTHGIGLMTFEK